MESPYTLGCKENVVCPKCSSSVRYFYVRESTLDLCIVDLICWKCGYRWSECWDSKKVFPLPSYLLKRKKRV